MDLSRLIADVYAKLDARDFDGLRSLFHSDAMLYIPGTTRISGDHAIDQLATVFGTYMEGLTHQDRFNVTAHTDHGYAFLADTVPVAGSDEPAHSHVLHHWFAKDDRLAAFWFFPHEYDVFERVWA